MIVLKKDFINVSKSYLNIFNDNMNWCIFLWLLVDELYNRELKMRRKYDKEI